VPGPNAVSLPCRRIVIPDLPLAAIVLGVLALVAWPAGLPADTADGSAEDIARQTVALTLGVAPDVTRIISSVPQDFPDASLGCPQPGMAYAQVITPGFQVLVEADGRRFDVRVAGTAGRICYRRKTPATATDEDQISPRKLAEAARNDLAGRLALPAEAVTIT
jgi:hypothetical protein